MDEYRRHEKIVTAPIRVRASAPGHNPLSHSGLLARVLAERLAQLDAVMPDSGCPTCRHAEASAFLAKLRKLLEANDGKP